MTMVAGNMTRRRRNTFVLLQSLVTVGLTGELLAHLDVPWVVDAAIAVLQVAAIYVIWPRRTE